MKVSEWLMTDPVSFDKLRHSMCFKIDHEVFEILVSRLKANHNSYFNEALGLKTRIKFKGYDGLVQAIVPYNANSVEFYLWWIEDPEKVKMTLAEKIKLFESVWMKSPHKLRLDHRRILGKK